MKRYLLILAGVACLALSPQERTRVISAQTKLHQAMEKYDAADKRAAEAEANALASSEYADGAYKYSQGVTESLKVLQGQVDDSQKKADKLATEVNSMRAEHKRVHSWFGIGGIFFGFSLLFHHLLWFLLVVVVIAIGLFVASFFFPVIGVGLRIAWAFVSRLGPMFSVMLARIRNLFKPKG